MKFIRVHRKSHILEVFSGEEKIFSFSCSVGKRNDAFPKIARGDLRTPLGTYLVIDKKVLSSQPRHGTRWLKINYPAKKDIITGCNIGLVDRLTMKKYLSACRKTGIFERKSILGYGIGIHGTDSPDTAGTDETEGCIRMKNTDMEQVYELADLGTPVIIEND